MNKRWISVLLAVLMLLSLGLGAAPVKAAAPAPALTDPGEPVRMIVELDEPRAFQMSLFDRTP